jgi:hypothetical protein
MQRLAHIKLTGSRIQITNHDYGLLRDVCADKRGTSVNFTVDDLASSGAKAPQLVLFDAVHEMIDSMTSDMHRLKTSSLACVGIGHYSQARLLRLAGAQVAGLIGCFSTAELEAVRRWFNVVGDIKNKSIIQTPRQTGKSTIIYAICAIIILYASVGKLVATAINSSLVSMIIIHENEKSARETLRGIKEFTEKYVMNTDVKERFVNARITHTQTKSEYNFGDMRVHLTAMSIESARGRSDNVVVVDELCRQSSDHVEKVLDPISTGTGDVAQSVNEVHCALYFTTPNPYTGPYNLALMTGDTATSRCYSGSLVCRSPECNDSPESMLRCRHKVAHLRPWDRIKILSVRPEGSSLETTLIESRGCETLITVSGMPPKLIETLLDTRKQIEWVVDHRGHTPISPRSSLPPFLNLTVCIDPDTAARKSRLGIVMSSQIHPPGKPAQVLILCATSINPRLECVEKQSIIYALVRLILTMYQSSLALVTSVNLIIESNNAQHASQLYAAAVKLAASDGGKPLLKIAIKNDQLQHAYHAETSVFMTNEIKMNMLECMRIGIENRRIQLADPAPFFAGSGEAGDARTIFRLAPVNKQYDLLSQMSKVEIKQTDSGGVTYSAKTSSESDDVLMATLLLVYVEITDMSAITPLFSYRPYVPQTPISPDEITRIRTFFKVVT